MADINNIETLISHIKHLKRNKGFNHFKVFDVIKQVAIKNNVWARYERNEETGGISRVLLSTYKYRSFDQQTEDPKSPLYYQSNALVIDADDWDVIAYNPLNFNKKLNKTKVNEFLKNKKYEITKINDGTTITLYPWKTRWAIASSNAWDVSNIIWIGTKTYVEIFKDLVDRLYPEFATETGMRILGSEGNYFLDFTKLDKNKAYTIGFRHYDFHPIKDDPEKIWQIQVIDLADPFNAEPADFDNCLPVFDMQEYVDKNTINSVDDIIALTENSVENATVGKKPLGSYAAAAASDDLPLIKTYNYGYLLSSTDRGVTKENSSILIPSEFLKKIRDIHYMDWGSSKINIDKSNIHNVKIMRSLLGPTKKKELFIAIHPEAEEQMVQFTKFIDEIIDNVHDKLKTENNKAKDSTYIEKLCEELAKHIKENSLLKPVTNIGREIVKDWCYEYKYSPVYTKIYFDEYVNK